MPNNNDKEQLQIYIHELENRYEQLQLAHEELRTQKNVLIESILANEAREKKYKIIIENSPGALFLTKPDGTILEVNKACCDMFGYSVAEFRQIGRQGFIDHSDENLKKLLLERKQYGKASGVVTAIRKNGERIKAEFSSVIFKDALTGEERTSTVMTNITERIQSENAILNSEKLYKDLFNLNPLPMWIYDYETTVFLDVNEAAIHHYGYSRNEFLGMSVLDIRPPQEQERLAAHGRKVKDGLKKYHGYWKHRKRNGEIIHVEITAQKLDYKGRQAVLVLSNDITQKIRVESKLIKSNRRLQSAQQIAQLGYWELNLLTLELYLSEQAYVILGWQQTETPLSYRDFFHMIHPDDRHLFKAKEAAIVNREKNISLEHRVILKDGTIKTLIQTGNLIYNEAGDPVFFEGTAQDITARKLAEIKLKAERNQLRVLIDNLPDSIYIKDVMGRKIITNKIDMQLMGAVSESEVIGKTDLEIFPGQTGIIGYGHDMEVIQTGNAVLNEEACYVDENGSKLWLLTSKVPIRNETGEINGLLGIGRIITARKQAEEALRASNERYVYATKATSDAIWDWDIVNDHLYWGEGYEKIFGYTIPENADNHIHSFDNIHPEDRESVFEGINALLCGNGVNWTSEYRNQKADGEYAFVEDKGIIIRDTTGRAVRMIGAMQDVTGRKKAEQAIKETQDKFTSLVNTVDGIVWEADARTFAFSYVSKHAEKLLGYPTHEWISDPGFWPAHIHPDDRNWAVDYCVSCTRQKKEHQFEYRMMAADGRVVWLADFVTVVLEMDQPVLLRGIMVDITERKKADEALVKERKLLRVLIDNLPDYIYVKDKDSRHIINNKANVSLLGFQSEEETLNKTIVELLGEDITGDFIKDDKQVLQSGDPILNREESIYNNKGDKRWLLTTKIPFKDEDGHITGLVGISRDVTEQKKTDERLKEKNSQLKNLSKHLQSIREEERKRLAREVHDELGQLASVVKMDIDWLMLRLPDLQEGPMKRIVHASSTTNLLLTTIRKIASSLRPGMLDELGLNASLEWQCKEFSALNGIPCEFEQVFDDEDLSNEIKTELFRICQESLTNVMRHAAATHVTVSIKDTLESLRLCITDNGKGFDVKHHTNTLGLIGMRERVLSINGKLSVVSQPGKGTTICADIPKKMIPI